MGKWPILDKIEMIDGPIDEKTYEHDLEKLQDRIARQLGFVVHRHRMELYGICAECREGRGAAAGAPAPARGILQV